MNKIFLTLLLLFGWNALPAAERFWVATTPSNWNNIVNWSTTSGNAGGLPCQALTIQYSLIPMELEIAIMKPLKIILIIAIFVFGCKKDDIHRPGFTSDQLQWIQNNLANPKFKIVTQKSENGNIVTSVDTVQTQTTIKVEEQVSGSVGWPEGDGSATYYYEGIYDLKFVNFFGFYVKASININNQFEFQVSYNNNFPINDTDSATIDGTYYSNVYKYISSEPTYGIFRKTYFKKGVGFLYLEKDSIGSTASVNYTASLIQ